jgi:hypothetical protein
MAGDLEELRILHTKLLPYLAHWCDLQTERERFAALEILESCLLVTRYSIGVSLPDEWVVNSRIKEPTPCATASFDLHELVQRGPVLC